MKSKLDQIYDDLNGRIKYGTLSFTDDPIKNLQILDQVMGTVNIAKCTLSDLENEMKDSATYLVYLLQSKNGVRFNFPTNIVVWVNQSGVRMRKID